MFGSQQEPPREDIRERMKSNVNFLLFMVTALAAPWQCLSWRISSAGSAAFGTAAAVGWLSPLAVPMLWPGMQGHGFLLPFMALLTVAFLAHRVTSLTASVRPGYHGHSRMLGEPWFCSWFGMSYKAGLGANFILALCICILLIGPAPGVAIIIFISAICDGICVSLTEVREKVRDSRYSDSRYEAEQAAARMRRRR